MRLYLAGPLFTPMERDFNVELKGIIEQCGHTVLLPQDNPESNTPSDIAYQDIAMLDSCDGVIAVCTGAEVDSGTAFEVGYALAKGKDILLYRPDKRQYFNAMLQGTCKVAITLDQVVAYYKTKPRHITKVNSVLP